MMYNIKAVLFMGILSLLPMQVFSEQVSISDHYMTADESFAISDAYLRDYQRPLLLRIKEKFSTVSNDVGARWLEFADEIDQRLSGDAYKEDRAVLNDSYLRLQLSETWTKNGELDTDIRLRARLDLPNTKKQLRLILDNDDDFNQSIESDVLNKRESDKKLQTAALQWMFKQGSKWNVSLTAGVRNLPLNPFVRVTSRRKNDLLIYGKEATGYFKTSLTYAKEDRFYLNGNYLIRLPRTDTSWWSNNSKVKWIRDGNDTEFVNTFAFDKKIDEKRSYTHSAGVSITNQPSYKTNNYFLQSTYRKNIYEDILYFSVTPTIEFPRSNNFSLTPSLNAKLALYFRKQK